MNGYDHFLSRHFTVAERDMATHLVVPIPSYPTKGPNEPIPGNIPRELGHTATSTVASTISVSAGMGSPCLRQLSR